MPCRNLHFGDKKQPPLPPPPSLPPCRRPLTRSFAPARHSYVSPLIVGRGATIAPAGTMYVCHLWKNSTRRGTAGGRRGSRETSSRLTIIPAGGEGGRSVSDAMPTCDLCLPARRTRANQWRNGPNDESRSRASHVGPWRSSHFRFNRSGP